MSGAPVRNQLIKESLRSRSTTVRWTHTDQLERRGSTRDDDELVGFPENEAETLLDDEIVLDHEDTLF